MPTLEKRFWAKVCKGEPDSCWLWIAYRDEYGYGRINVGGKPTHAHRIAWELTYGPIPDGLLVLHNCPEGDTPACCNPAHLWLGTNADNRQDCTQKRRNTWGERVPTAKLTAAQVHEIREAYAQTHESQHAIARRYGIGYATVWDILQRKTWKHE